MPTCDFARYCTGGGGREKRVRKVARGREERMLAASLQHRQRQRPMAGVVLLAIALTNGVEAQQGFGGKLGGKFGGSGAGMGGGLAAAGDE